jgi:hypothetical protein
VPRYNALMRSAKQTLDETFLEMRWRCLSLAADFDRIERATGGSELLATDPRVQSLRQAIQVLLKAGVTRAEIVQQIFSDKTPPPDRNPNSAARLSSPKSIQNPK